MGALNGKIIDSRIKNACYETQSFLCHPNGIVIGVSLYQCTFCSFVISSPVELREHYEKRHFSRKLTNSRKHKSLANTSLLLVHANSYDLQCSSYLTHCSSESIDDSDYEEPESPITPIKTSMDDHNVSNLGSPTPKQKKSNVSAMNCEVCKTDRYFACVQTHYGRHICVFCNRFFKRFITSPCIYTCSRLGQCDLINGRDKCKACLLQKCLQVYKDRLFDDDLRQTLETYKPITKLKSYNRSRSSIKSDMSVSSTPDTSTSSKEHKMNSTTLSCLTSEQ